LRYGRPHRGDKFVILLEERHQCPDVVVRLALEATGEVRLALGAPLQLECKPYQITASIGVGLVMPGADPHDLCAKLKPRCTTQMPVGVMA